MNIAIIPARGGSKRLPRKNIRNFEGVPIIVRALHLARRAGCFDEVLVSTDDAETAALALKYGASVPFFRSSETSDDHATTFEVVHEVLDKLEKLGREWDIGVCIYPTAVLARPQQIRDAVESIARGITTSVMPVARFQYPIWRAMSVRKEGHVSFVFTENTSVRSQDVSETYHDAGQWYAFDVTHLRRYRSFMDVHTRAVILAATQVQDIDTLEDWELATIKYGALQAKDEPVTARMQPWVLLRVDATTSTGSGHIMRCLALAQAFADRQYNVVFVSAECPDPMRKVITDRGFESVLLERALKHDDFSQVVDAALTLEWIDKQSSEPAWIIVDHYGLDVNWERAIRACGSHLVVVDDLADRPHDCDALVDQNMLSVNHERYLSLVPPTTRLMLGGKFALLRSEFAFVRERRNKRLLQGILRDVIVFLGGVDQGQLTIPLAENLQKHFKTDELIVIVGHLNNQCDVIAQWCAKNGLRCHCGVDNLAILFEDCRLLVAACGMTAVEAQAVGIPCILLPLTPIQQDVAEWFATQQRAIVLNPAQCLDDDAVMKAVKSAVAIRPEAPQESPISINGATNVIAELLEMHNE